MGFTDFISSLPDEVLGKKILSLLPTKLVVSTSVLSKRWRNLFLFVDKFDLEDPTSLKINDSFSDFMEKTVALLSNCPIKRLTLNCYYEQYSLDRWIRSALQRGCLELNLQCQYGHCLDIGIFSSSNTLVKLTLSSRRTLLLGNVPLEEGTVFFPALKTLSLGNVVADPALYNWLISGCPVLEELCIRDVGDEVKGMWILSTCRVKVLEISRYGGSVREVRQMAHFLGKLKYLETVKIGVEDNNNNNRREFLRAKLMTLDRASSVCNIQFI